mmetsp:Transcript_58131/g.118940  ORF Transcript_58131/g.118940 Transcript_58131/m.118940 type:complete len:242 (-) Transcript_58131:17-742(-)
MSPRLVACSRFVRQPHSCGILYPASRGGGLAHHSRGKTSRSSLSGRQLPSGTRSSETYGSSETIELKYCPIACGEVRRFAPPCDDISWPSERCVKLVVTEAIRVSSPIPTSCTPIFFSPFCTRVMIPAVRNSTFRGRHGWRPDIMDGIDPLEQGCKHACASVANRNSAWVSIVRDSCISKGFAAYAKLNDNPSDLSALSSLPALMCHGLPLDPTSFVTNTTTLSKFCEYPPTKSSSSTFSV